MRIIFRVTVLLAWAAMMAALYQRVHPRFDLTSPPEFSPAREKSEEWQGIYGGGRKIGYAVSRRAPTADGFVLENDAVIRLTMMGSPQIVSTRVSAETDAELRLRRFRFRVRSGTVEFSADGSVQDGNLRLAIDSGTDRARTVDVPLSGPIVLPQMLHESLSREKLEPGRTFRYAMFDPVSGAPAPVVLTVGALETVEVSGEARRAFAVTEEYQGSRFRLWVDPNGSVLREEGPLGLTLVRESAAAAAAGFDRDGALDLIAASAIPAGKAIPSPREIRHLTLRMEGFPPDQNLSFPPRQSVSQGTLEIRAEDVSALSSFTLPAPRQEFGADLEATTFMQSDDPRITALARKIVASEGDARRVAEKLLHWVYNHVEKVPTVSVPNALEVLESRKGDCNEHSVLYAALARAAGLPARVVAGAVYMPGEGDTAGAFYYHAWNEVWIGQWAAVDATFGQFPADATHVKFLEGGPETHARLLGVVGRVKLSVESFG